VRVRFRTPRSIQYTPDAKGVPLSSGSATDGALLAARDIVSKLESHS
jgi:hypothetical protein